MNKFFYNIADKNACFSINYQILVTRDTITNDSIGWLPRAPIMALAYCWLQTRHNGLVWMKILSKTVKENWLIYSLTINEN